MKANKEDKKHFGNNAKYLMQAFGRTQAEIAEKLEMHGPHLCNLLQKANIDDETLQRIADAIGYGVTVDTIKNYNHDDTTSYIINNYNQKVENGGTGTLIPNQTFEEGSSQNNYTAEKAFEYAERNTKLEKLLLYYRMKVEPDAVEKEIESLKRDCDPG